MTEGERFAKCTYCGATSQVKSGRTVATPQVPPGFQPPPSGWPPSTATSAPSTANVFRPESAAPPRGNAGCAVTVGVLVAVAGIGGVAAFTGLRGGLVSRLDPNAAPTAGTVQLGAQTAAPAMFPATAGGSINGPLLGADCRGHYAAAPQLVLRVTTVQRVTVTSHGNDDLTLAIRQPSGLFRCDDDSGEGTNPRLELTLTPGVYPVWFGTFRESYTSHFEAVVEAEPLGSVPLANGLAVGTPPTLGAMALAGPSVTATREGIAGGRVDANTLGSNCRGHIPAVPHLTLLATEARHLVLTTTSTTDLTMVVRDANGVLHCDDDSGEGSQPRIETYVTPGAVQVWVGVYSGDTRPPFTLSVQSESTGGVLPFANGLSPMGPPTVTTLDLDRAGAVTRLQGLLGGSIDARTVAPGCTGWITPTPQLRMTMGVARRVTLTASGGVPVSLLARGPNGDMQCVDAHLGRTPTLAADFPVGATAVWVASPSPRLRTPFHLDVTAQSAGAVLPVK